MKITYEAIVSLVRRVVQEEIAPMDTEIGIKVSKHQLRQMIKQELGRYFREIQQSDNHKKGMSAQQLLQMQNAIERSQKGKLNEPPKNKK